MPEEGRGVAGVRELPRRGPSRRAAAEAQQRRVLTAAGEVFARRGFHATQMEEIAVRAGISKPIVYKHFTSKLELYSEVVQAHADRLVSEVRRAMNIRAGNLARARAAVSVYFDFVEYDPDSFRMLFDTTLPSEPSVRRCTDRAVDDCVHAVAGILARDLDTDLDQARLVAAGLMGICRFTAQQWSDGGRQIPKEHAMALAVTLCVRGLSAGARGSYPTSCRDLDREPTSDRHGNSNRAHGFLNVDLPA
ncbi:TetR/AcrR family transcriptional regulator [Nocardia sp. NPDC005978]|uniref:TetR/AcrR family transcriptional regulator n=1 Tax=Nocardia sp. NPDC005978 TaxID=3156725 RepID=UPI0033BB2AE7